MTGSPSAHRVGQQAQEARALDRLGELALLLGRDRGDAARHDLAALGNEALQQLHVLVVDLRRVRPGERARLAAPEERPPGPAGTTAAATAHRTAAAIMTLAHAPAPSVGVA